MGDGWGEELRKQQNPVRGGLKFNNADSHLIHNNTLRYISIFETSTLQYLEVGRSEADGECRESPLARHREEPAGRADRHELPSV